MHHAMGYLNHPTAASEGERHCDGDDPSLPAARKIYGVQRRSADKSINAARRQRRADQITGKVKRMLLSLSAASMSLSNATPGALTEPNLLTSEVRFAIEDIEIVTAEKAGASSSEMMLANCRSKLDGSIRGINDAAHKSGNGARAEHIVTEVFDIEEQRASAVSLFRVQDHRGFEVVKEIRAEVALPSCAISTL